MTICSCGYDLGSRPPATCPKCGRAVVASAPTARPAGAPLKGAAHPCPNCRSAMTPFGELEFRVGGYGGVEAALLGDFNELQERIQPFNAYYCPRCGRVDLYWPGR